MNKSDTGLTDSIGIAVYNISKYVISMYVGVY